MNLKQRKSKKGPATGGDDVITLNGHHYNDHNNKSNNNNNSLEEANSKMSPLLLPMAQHDSSADALRKATGNPFRQRQQKVVLRLVLLAVLVIGSGIMLIRWFGLATTTLPPPPPSYYTISSNNEYSNTQEALEEWNKIHNDENGTTTTGGIKFIHLLHSRFMQEQGHLTSLAWARLLLFQVFCLPSIVHQSSQNFLWLIKMDPNLNQDVLRHLIAIVEPFDNIYLIASNHNFLISQDQPGLWRTSEIRELQSNGDGSSSESSDPTTSQDSGTIGKRIYTGNRKRLALAMALANDLTVLETRLDADDGLHKDYMQYIQQQVMKEFHPNNSEGEKGADGHKNKKPQLLYKYWCSRRSLEWHWQLHSQQPEQIVTGVADNKREHKNNNNDDEITNAGVLQIKIHNEMCITPGITVGYPAGVDESQVAVIQHNKLFQRLVAGNNDGRPCGALNPQDCIVFVNGDFTFDAIRSRTPTSAGMLEVLAASTATVPSDPDSELWQDPTRTSQHGQEVGRKLDSAALAASIATSSSSSSTTTSHHDKQPHELHQSTPWMQYAFWHFLYESFYISRDQVLYVQNYFQGSRLFAIAQDNLLGQCTSFHSCKESSKLHLQTILNMTQPRTATGEARA
ncbi:hypothetical protein ACA910_014575 [Epithemia clementina (nom. ined.)]